jgi:hypothetical protein
MGWKLFFRISAHNCNVMQLLINSDFATRDVLAVSHICLTRDGLSFRNSVRECIDVQRRRTYGIAVDFDPSVLTDIHPPLSTRRPKNPQIAVYLGMSKTIISDYWCFENVHRKELLGSVLSSDMVMQCGLVEVYQRFSRTFLRNVSKLLQNYLALHP